MARFLENGTKKVAEWRWNSIVDSLLIILPLQPLFQTAWRPKLFAQHHGGGAEDNQTEQVHNADPIADLYI